MKDAAPLLLALRMAAFYLTGCRQYAPAANSEAAALAEASVNELYEQLK